MSQPFDEHNTEITSIQPMCDESPWHPDTVDKLLLSGILLQGLLTASHLHYNTPTQWSPLKLHCKDQSISLMFMFINYKHLNVLSKNVHFF